MSFVAVIFPLMKFTGHPADAYLLALTTKKLPAQRQRRDFLRDKTGKDRRRR